MPVAYVDFETRSTCDLRKRGAYVYAKDPTTEILCMAWAIGDGAVGLWQPKLNPGEPFPEELKNHIRDGHPVSGWNSLHFERLIWTAMLLRDAFHDPKHERVHWPDVPTEQWVDSMHLAAALGLPRALGQCAAAIKAPVQKDSEGYNLMMRMCKPRKVHPTGDIEWWEDAPRLRRLGQYCITDVETERAIAKRLVQLDEGSREAELATVDINDHGLYLDVPLVEAAAEVAGEAIKRVNARMNEVTDGEVTAVTQVAKLGLWLDAKGIATKSVDKESLEDILYDNDDLDPDVVAAIECRLEGAKTSVSKINAMLNRLDDDGRVRGVLRFNGAHTGRWSHEGVQFGNMPRQSPPDIGGLVKLVMARNTDAIEAIYEKPMSALSQLIRSLIVPAPGFRFMGGDYAAIEARGTGWVAGDDALIAEFEANDRGEGEEPYCIMGGTIFNRPVTKADTLERFLGKQTVLGCGYGMGPPKFVATCKKLGTRIDENLGRLAVYSWREKNYLTVRLWQALDDAAREAIASPGQVVQVDGTGGKLKFAYRGGILWYRLPSGRKIAYLSPEVRQVPAPWNPEQTIESLTVVGRNHYTNRWERMTTWGGKLLENAVQGFCADLLRYSMHALTQQLYPVVLTVHDEILAEVREGFGDLDTFRQLMAQTQGWAAGLPVRVDVWEGDRYVKV